MRVLSTGDTGPCSAGGTLFATASTSACCLAVNFSGTALSVARIAMVWRLTMIDSGGLLSGLNAGQRAVSYTHLDDAASERACQALAMSSEEFSRLAAASI